MRVPFHSGYIRPSLFLFSGNSRYAARQAHGHTIEGEPNGTPEGSTWVQHLSVGSAEVRWLAIWPVVRPPELTGTPVGSSWLARPP